MKGLVAYHSKWGSGKKIAENIAAGLTEAGHDITLKSVDDKDFGSGYDFLVAGSGTRAGHMTGPMHRFIGRLRKKEWAGKLFIAYGTGAQPKGDGSKTDKYATRSAERIYDALVKKGLRPATDAYKAHIEQEGPSNPRLMEGAEERARTFGLETGKTLLGQ